MSLQVEAPTRSRLTVWMASCRGRSGQNNQSLTRLVRASQSTTKPWSDGWAKLSGARRMSRRRLLAQTPRSKLRLWSNRLEETTRPRSQILRMNKLAQTRLQVLAEAEHLPDLKVLDEVLTAWPRIDSPYQITTVPQCLQFLHYQVYRRKPKPSQVQQTTSCNPLLRKPNSLPNLPPTSI